MRSLLTRAGKSAGWIIASLFLACGIPSFVIAQESPPQTPDSPQSQRLERAETDEEARLRNIDRFDDLILTLSSPDQDMKDGLVYKPDAIPLSQYRRKPESPEDIINFINANITGDGKSERSYYAAIYSGSTSGVYFKVAARICDLMRRTYELHRVRCVPLRSQGVASNISLMKEGRAQMAVMQSNNNWEAAEGINPIPGAQSVMSLHDETGLLVVRRDADIDSVADLRGKRINIGPKGSASRELWIELLEQNDLELDDFETVYNVAQDYNELGICEDYIDAFGLWIGHPVPVIEESLRCDAKVVGMGGASIQTLIEERPYFFEQSLPKQTYSGQDQAIDSYGFKASLLAYEPADPYVVYWVTRTVHENIEKLRAEYPTFRSISADDLFKKGNFLPFHKGAACYWETRPDACDWQADYQPVSLSRE